MTSIADHGDAPPRPVLSIERPVLTADEEQDQWLAVSMRVVDEHVAHMRASMQAGDVRASMRAAATAFAELSVDTLAPHRYYELYMHIFDAAQELCMYLAQVYSGNDNDDNNDNEPLEQLYEEAQYLTAIVPRLYLVMVVGGAYMAAVQRRTSADAHTTASTTTTTRELLRDMVDLCKGVQHPTRGLFLRHFLLSMTKGHLPGESSNSSNSGAHDRQKDATTTAATTTRTRAEDDDGGDNDDGDSDDAALDETIGVLLHNLSEMTWLWIRMEAARPPPPPTQHQQQQQQTQQQQQQQQTSSLVVMPAQFARRIRQERSELRVLVGMNVVRIASLDGVDAARYRRRVLPRLLSIVVKYREAMAQQYLFEVIVHVFPAEYHAQTLQPLLAALLCLAPDVDVCETMRVLLERLATYAASLRASSNDDDADADASEHDRNDDTRASSSAAATASSIVVRDVFDGVVAALRSAPVVYDARPRIDRMIKRTSSTPARTPLGFAAYLDILTSLVKFVGATTTPSTTSTTTATDATDMAHARIDAVLQCAVERYNNNNNNNNSTAATPHESKTTTHTTAAAVVPSRAALRATVKLLLSVLAHTPSVYRALELHHFRALAARLPHASSRAIALAVCEAALHDAATTTTTATTTPTQRHAHRRHIGMRDVTHLFALLMPLVRDDAADAKGEWANEQQTLCRVLHLLPSTNNNDDNDDDNTAAAVTYAAMLRHAHAQLASGSVPSRARTFPTLASLYTRAALQLHDALTHAQQQQQQEQLQSATSDTTTIATLTTALTDVFRALYSGDGDSGVLEALSRERATLAYYLYLDAAATADVCARHDDAHDLYTEAFSLYEQYAADTCTQLAMLTAAMNALYATSRAGATHDMYAALVGKVAQYSATLLRRHDQCVMLARCAWLWLRGACACAATSSAATRPSADDSEQPSCDRATWVRRARQVLLRALRLRAQVLPAHRTDALVRLVGVVVALLDAHVDMLVPSHDEAAATPAADEVAAATTALLRDLRDAHDDARGANEDDGEGKSSNSSSRRRVAEAAEATTTSARALYDKTAEHIRKRAARDARWQAIDLT